MEPGTAVLLEYEGTASSVYDFAKTSASTTTFATAAPFVVYNMRCVLYYDVPVQQYTTNTWWYSTTTASILRVHYYNTTAATTATIINTTILLFTGVHSNQDLICCVLGVYSMGFFVQG